MKLHKVSRLAPVSINDLPGIQGWLQSMAAQGFLLDCCDNGTFLFDRKEPVRRRYRIDPSKGNTMGVATPQLQDTYREFGWTYVDSYTRYHHVFYTDDPSAVEPFTTPEALAEKLERVKRRKIRYYIVSLSILFLLNLWMILNPASYSFQRLLNIPIFILVGCLAFHDLAPLFKIKQTSEDGSLLKPRNPDGTDRKLRYLRICSSSLLVVLLVWRILSRII